jgi:uncharacterized SAM-binding protein YcdF (DUF218 family)
MRCILKQTTALIILAAIFLLILFSSRAGAFMLMRALESHAIPLASPLGKEAQAIVVLGGGTEREAYSAKLQQESGLPLLVSGEEAPAMVRTLAEEFGTPVRWVEQNSHTTEENALFSACILKQNGINRLILITDAAHMLRAETIFTKNGFDVIPAPVTFSSHSPLSLNDFLPSRDSWIHSRNARHELLGIAWFYAGHIMAKAFSYWKQAAGPSCEQPGPAYLTLR